MNKTKASVKKSASNRIICKFCCSSLTQSHFYNYGHSHGLCSEKKENSFKDHGKGNGKQLRMRADEAVAIEGNLLL